MDAPVRKQQYLDFPDSLEHLNLDFAYLYLVTRVLDRINMSSLRFLAVPEYYTRALESHSQTGLCDFVQQSEKGLESLRITRAWGFENNHLASLQSLQEFYAVDDLVLGTRNDWYYTGFISDWRQKVPTPTLSDYLYGFSWLGSEGMAGRWGGTLKRIRVDHIDISQDLDISVLSQSLWQELKILMLQPAARNLEYVERHDTKLVNEAVCDELVQRIVLCASQSLCVVVISAQWYWITRNTDANPLKVWPWTAAKLDALQDSSMNRILDNRDIDFLDNNDVPYWYERDTKEWHRELASSARTRPHSPSSEMLHQWNYLAMYRAHDRLSDELPTVYVRQTTEETVGRI